MICIYCKLKKIKAYLVPQEEFLFGNWSVKANWCGECKPLFLITRERMILVKEELLKKFN